VSQPAYYIISPFDGPRTAKRTPMACQFCRGKGPFFLISEFMTQCINPLGPFIRSKIKVRWDATLVRELPPARQPMRLHSIEITELMCINLILIHSSLTNRRFPREFLSQATGSINFPSLPRSKFVQVASSDPATGRMNAPWPYKPHNKSTLYWINPRALLVLCLIE